MAVEFHLSTFHVKLVLTLLLHTSPRPFHCRHRLMQGVHRETKCKSRHCHIEKQHNMKSSFNTSIVDVIVEVVAAVGHADTVALLVVEEAQGIAVGRLGEYLSAVE